MAEIEPAVIDVGRTGMNYLITALNKKLEALPKAFAKEMAKKVDSYFAQEGSFWGKWAPLSKVTITEKRKATILQKTGALRKSIDVVELGKNEAALICKDPSGVIHEFGAIVPTAGKKGEEVRRAFIAKHIKSEGVIMPLRKTTYGIKIPERPFMRPAFDDVLRNFRQIAEKYLGEGAKELQFNYGEVEVD